MELEGEAEVVLLEGAGGFGVKGGEEGDGFVCGEGHIGFLSQPMRLWATRTHQLGGVVIM
jgi:hypothetical protein